MGLTQDDVPSLSHNFIAPWILPSTSGIVCHHELDVELLSLMQF